MDALVVRTPDRRLTADTLNAVLDADPDVSNVAALVCTSGTTNGGIIDELAGSAEIASNAAGGSTSTAYGGSGIFARSLRESMKASSKPTRSSSTRTSGFHAVRLLCAHLPAT
jgi:aromatic-L-amino-acid/L-tryptophan decarboxylase